MKKCREKKKGGADGGHPANREGYGKGKEKNLLVWQGGCEGKKERIMKIERIDGDGGLQECHGYD